MQLIADQSTGGMAYGINDKDRILGFAIVNGSYSAFWSDAGGQMNAMADFVSLERDFYTSLTSRMLNAADKCSTRC